ncbi:hypothetical protein K439DRAFT_1633635, partial [Ramaria rubella]
MCPVDPRNTSVLKSSISVSERRMMRTAQGSKSELGIGPGKRRHPPSWDRLPSMLMREVLNLRQTLTISEWYQARLNNPPYWRTLM